MESHSDGAVKITVGEEEVFIRYSFLIKGSSVEVSLEMDDIIKLLEISGNSTLKDLGFEAVINVHYVNGREEEITIPMPNVIMNATIYELKSNRNLYIQPYYTNWFVQYTSYVIDRNTIHWYLLLKSISKLNIETMSKYTCDFIYFKRKLKKYYGILKYVKRQRLSEVKLQLIDLLIESTAIVREILRGKYEIEPILWETLVHILLTFHWEKSMS